VDCAGVDHYQPLGEAPRADGDDRVTSFSMLLDVGGSDDVYLGVNENNTIHHGDRHGLFCDLPGDLESAVADPSPLIH
jgi:hypothetical protein